MPIIEDDHKASAGFVYVLSNPSMPNIVKIGSTERNVKERVAELSSTTGVPTPFRIEYSLLTENPKELEFTLHEEFVEHRINGNREFFSIAPEVVVKRLRQIRYDRLLSEFQNWDENELSEFSEQLWLALPRDDFLDKVFVQNKADLWEHLRKMPTLLVAEVLHRLFQERPEVWREIK
jgi:hypothetical protein